MATDLELLQTAKSNLLSALATHGHKRSYNIDGQQVSYSDLWDRLEKLDKAIASAQGPFEIADQGVT